MQQRTGCTWEKTDFSVTFRGECEFFLRLWNSGLHTIFLPYFRKNLLLPFAPVFNPKMEEVCSCYIFLPLRGIITLKKNAYFNLFKTLNVKYNFVWVYLRGVKNHRTLAFL
jgi:hypothetical protein